MKAAVNNNLISLFILLEFAEAKFILTNGLALDD